MLQQNLSSLQNDILNQACILLRWIRQFLNDENLSYFDIHTLGNLNQRMKVERMRKKILTKCWQSSNWSGIKVGGWGKICASFSLKVELNNKLFDICRFHNSQFARQVSQDAVPSSRLDARFSWATSRPTSRQRGPDAGIQVVFAFFQ